MPILFGNLWKNADQFSFELQTKGFDPLQGELRLWWVIFRNVQNDLQINASTINKARYLTIQEWVILSKTYSNSKIYFETSVLDLIKQDVKATSKAFSAGEASNLEEKFLIGENINENVLNQGLVNFINKLDVHFNNLARISPMAKLLREYRSRIGLAIPFYGATTDVQPPTFGSPPIYTNPNGAIELLYDPEVLMLNAEGQLTTIASAPHLYDFTAPLHLNHYTASLLYNPNDFNLNSDNQLTIIDTHKSLIGSVSNPLTITDRNLALNYNPTDFNLNTNNQLSIIDQHKSVINTVSDPLSIDNKNLSLRYSLGGPFYVEKATGFLELRLAAPLTEIDNEEQHINSIGLKIGSHLGLNADGALDALPYRAVEPLRLTNNVEFSIGYESPLFETTEHNLGVKIDNTTITLNGENQLQAVTQIPSFASPLYLNPQNQLTLNYTPTFKLNAQQQLDLKLANPLILDSNHALSLNYSGGLWLSNNQLKINLSAAGGNSINSYNELVNNVDGSTIFINGQNALSLNANLKTDITTSKTKIAAAEEVLTQLSTKVEAEKTRLTQTDHQLTINTNKLTQLNTNVNTNTTRVLKAINDLTNLSNKVGTFKTDIDLNNDFRHRLRYTNQLLSQINNRLTIITDASKCSDEILFQDHYRFQNKIENSHIRSDDLYTVPTNKKIVNVKGSFFIQHNYGGFRFATFTLNRFQKYKFETHPNNLYYANYVSYFSNDISLTQVLLRIYQQGNKLKYNIISNDITPNEGYNIECDFQVLTCDSQDTGRRSWKLIEGDIFLNNVEWKYKFPNNLKLTSTQTYTLSWVYNGSLYTCTTIRVSFGTWVSLYLNGHSGHGWDFKIIDQHSFSIKSADTTPLIQNLVINIV